MNALELAQPQSPRRLTQKQALRADVRDICAAAGMPENFFNDIAALPPTFQLVRIKVQRAAPEDVKRLREEFNDSVKKQFLKFIAQNHAQELVWMGIRNPAIDRMAEYGVFPKDETGERLNCSVDHIRALKFVGGNNKFKNLTIIHSKTNAMKDRLENLQWPPGQQEGTVITIVPARRNQAYMRVPHVHGGFKPRNTHA